MHIFAKYWPIRQTIFTATFNSKFAIKRLLKILYHTYVVTLFCDILVFKNWTNSTPTIKHVVYIDARLTDVLIYSAAYNSNSELEVLGEHRPPLNASIIELLNDFCNCKLHLWSESTRYFFDNPMNLDFGLRTPGSGRWSGSSPKFNHLVPGSYALPLQKFRQNPFTTFSVIRRTDKQTDKQTYKQTEVKT